ncbi:MAG: GGDEF domain-containing protein [Actinobacteria bacterium]|nr:GGDEF domain-containing protein [Actinomycetota bacterium]
MIRWGIRSQERRDQFDWSSAYLKDRGLQKLWRVATFASTIALAAQPVMLLWSPVGPVTPAGTVVCVVASALAVAGALLWLSHWPTRGQSLIFSAIATASIAGTCLALSNPYSGLMGCVTFGVLGGFVAYFHSLDEVVGIVGVAAVCATILAVRLIASTGDVALAAAALITVAIVNIGVPFGVQSLVHSLRTDLRGSDRDPLTGLHNRRSFGRSAYELMMRHRGEARFLVVTMIDLDNFKHLNDTFGHAAGDEALIGVGAALEENCRHSAVIGRAGGEEFVIADIHAEPEPVRGAELLRQAIADTPARVTASIGTASAPLGSSLRGRTQLIDDLVQAADAAMYEAKRAGGNQVRHSQYRLPQ